MTTDPTPAIEVWARLLRDACHYDAANLIDPTGSPRDR
jgi:hypothetical protein